MPKLKNALFLVLLLTATALVLSFKESIKGKVVCFGDSITFGARAEGHSWVSLLAADHPGDAEFINEGRSGRKTSQRTELLPVLDKYPDAAYYLVFLGVNDLKDGNDSMVNDCVINIKWMIAQIHNKNPQTKIVLLAPTGINLATMSDVNVQKKYNANTSASLVKLEQRYKQLAKEEHTGFISLLHVVSPQNYADGLHPDANGQKEIAAAVWDGLK
ncbi:MAG TPA: SGNH/GDSL hydrolase family protein [Chitinophagaceae bacterium]|jgi:lysophospholipase L1-like esterase